MSKLNYKKGFTLIELLVVVAIIGILSSVVLASLNSARSKGADAAIKANLRTIQTQATLYYDTKGHYGPATGGALDCASNDGTMFSNHATNGDPTILSAVTEINNRAGVMPKCAAALVSGSYATSWAVSATLKGGGNWCVDSTGNSKNTTAVMVSGVANCQ
ncbi:MAG: type II secretion system GspH family protein [Candidatus Pacebacteria bacterium]|nr:type II secretion system GspH family protein [Candidatus Paceibacterota bacterium]MCF7862554.1 type II secretion system GspH family protein [Candidatus Paceibacterota bacterium]